LLELELDSDVEYARIARKKPSGRVAIRAATGHLFSDGQDRNSLCGGFSGLGALTTHARVKDLNPLATVFYVLPPLFF
jgi:hypothetical protein